MLLRARDQNEATMMVHCDPCFKDAIEIATAAAIVVRARVISVLDVPVMVRRSQVPGRSDQSRLDSLSQGRRRHLARLVNLYQ